MFRPDLRWAVMAGLALSAAPALAQDNRIFLLQENPTGAPGGNTLFVDQTQAQNSLVAGEPDASAPALQIGAGNSGDIRVRSSDTFVEFRQGSMEAPAFGNTALVTVESARSSAALQQLGSDNFGTLGLGLGLPSTQLQAGLLQIGNGNLGAVDVDGVNVRGVLEQVGNRNNTELSVSGVDSDVTYRIVGDNLSTLGAGPSVFTNAGTVVIRQVAPGQN